MVLEAGHARLRVARGDADADVLEVDRGQLCFGLLLHQLDDLHHAVGVFGSIQVVPDHLFG